LTAASRIAVIAKIEVLAAALKDRVGLERVEVTASVDKRKGGGGIIVVLAILAGLAMERRKRRR
jgi:F0F1-type ATP synthase delta subunit